MKALITGGSGFIGTNFIRSFLKKESNTLINLDDLTLGQEDNPGLSSEEKERYSFYKGSIGDKILVSKLLNELKPESIINFAAESHVDRSILDPLSFANRNIIETINFLDCLKNYYLNLNEEKSNKFRFIHISTDEVYGSLEIESKEKFSEETIYHPNNPYSASKAASDHFVTAFSSTYGLPSVITHCSNNFGPYQAAEKLIPVVIQNCLSNTKIPVYGNGLNIRDWIYVEDHCKAINQILCYSDKSYGEIFNISAEFEINNLELVKLILDIMGKPHTLINYVDDRMGHDKKYSTDSSKMKKKFDWKIEKTFEDNMETTIAWYVKNKEWLNKSYHRFNLTD